MQQLKKQGRNSGFALWKELRETLTGEDRKAYNRKLLAKKLRDTWKTQSVSLLAYKGEMEEVFRLAKAAGENWDEARRMEEFLTHFDDPEWKSYISERAREVRDKKISTVAAFYSDLSGEERRMEAQSTRARDTSPSAARRTTSDKPAPGSTSHRSVGTKNIDLARLALPSALWKDMGDRARVFFLQWKDALIKNGGNFSELYSMSPPPNDVVAAFNKNAKRKRSDHEDSTKDKKMSKRSKARRNKAERKAALEAQGVLPKSSSESGEPYLSSTSSRLVCLVDDSDTKKHHPEVHNLPVLRVVMFKDPHVEVSMSPIASSAQGPLAICAGRSANPSAAAIDMKLSNYTYKAAPLTKLSDINIRFRRLYAWRLCGSKHRPPKSVSAIRSQSKVIRRAHSEERSRIL